MHQFTDSKNETWEIRITAGTVKRCADLLRVDIGDPTRGDPPLMTRIDTDICFMVDLLYVVCKPEADARNISDIQFAERLEGEALFAAHEAFFEDLADFFRSLRKGNFAEALARQRQLAQQSAAAGERALGSETTKQAIDRQCTELGESVAALLASAASPQSPAPSAS
jgi:hypothetical protein